MTNYEKLVEKLKEVEEIKNDLEAIYSHKWFHTKGLYNYGFLLGPDVAFFPGRGIEQVDKKFLELQEFKGELEERHLRIYCAEYNIRCTFKNIFFEEEEKSASLLFLKGKQIVELDNTKPFHLQDDKVYGEILDYLNNI